ncbi:MAG TPA: NUDIX domain-containing protein [Actinophytocola sp.]|uniref:NUDIX domain-containing protein n=1 Tax=Actinophytocola sp. TaxID=1872138 RepID=UPI002DDDA3F1|nr:NUDIX domain-containing protein [Actinophytocola sp.]HEV2784269.1 NUDIX domain-containing protein [Actinophytocola sp.]
MGLRDGDRFTRCAQGHVHWGKYGAAGLLMYHDGRVLLQRRAWWTPGGNTWGLFGGARHGDEDPIAAARREAAEECSLPADAGRVHGIISEDHGDWAYHTVLGTMDEHLDVEPDSMETSEAAWVPVSEVDKLRLFGPFANAWPRLRAGVRKPVLVVDCANVMGARADGWWRDRKGAATRLRDDLGRLAECGTTELEPFDLAFPEIVLVVEGAARGIGPGPTGVEVVDAPGSGDDTIVSLFWGYRTTKDSRQYVVTADRELRARSEAEGATALGPRWLLNQLSRG